MTARKQRMVDIAMIMLVVLVVIAFALNHHQATTQWFIGMTLVVPNVGEVLALKAFLNHTAGQNGVLRLYKSNTTPAETDTFATYTESTFTGYSAATLTGSSWTVTGGAPTTASYAQQTFSSSADQTLENAYGYVVNQTTSTILMWAERFAAAPYAITNNGDQILITPQITLE